MLREGTLSSQKVAKLLFRMEVWSDSKAQALSLWLSRVLSGWISHFTQRNRDPGRRPGIRRGGSRVGIGTPPPADLRDLIGGPRLAWGVATG